MQRAGRKEGRCRETRSVRRARARTRRMRADVSGFLYAGYHGALEVRRLDAEDILLHCMPQDVWERRPNTLRYLGCAELFYPKRPILPTDTERLMFYAPLVNKLSVGHPVDDIHDREREVGLSEEGYEAIVSVLPHPVFVNLRHLVWHTLCGGLSHIQQYLSPSLRSLTLKLSWDARPHISLLSDLADRCPFVTSFHLDTEFKSYDVEDNDELKILHSRLIRPGTFTP
ncbi:hypothetical protein BD626DRAFT_187274 [Schizophyllum amplum]|uniref:F-box domain-containing protein n=1 Tax=Schizophyllum amplum TaxID=97359 RepID=A0A550C0L3_9AGAR|nr:hypothetical protein BD626DRAFT_187274 [Auriculariopsis ampla]